MEWPDSRLHPGKGHLETRRLLSRVAPALATAAIGGNGSRVRLIVAGLIADPDLNTIMNVCAADGMVANSPIYTLTADHPSVILRIEDIGDAIFGPFAFIAQAGFGSVTVYEVVWHPLEK